MLLDYSHTYYQNMFLRSDMQLHVDSDASYLVAKDSKSRIATIWAIKRISQTRTTSQMDQHKLNAKSCVTR